MEFLHVFAKLAVFHRPEDVAVAGIILAMGCCEAALDRDFPVPGIDPTTLRKIGKYV